MIKYFIIHTKRMRIYSIVRSVQTVEFMGREVCAAIATSINSHLICMEIVNKLITTGFISQKTIAISA